MRSNKKLLAHAKLYLILDTSVLGHDQLIQVLKDSVRAGIDIVQLRDKKSSAKKILDFSRKILGITQYKTLFIVNDRADLSLLSGADGLHVGQEDLDYHDARKILGPSKIVGVSCQTLAQALKAQRQGADYIGFGSVFKTKTKPEREAMDLVLLKKVLAQVKIPVFPIGGIKRANIAKIISVGAKRVAVCRDILLAKDVGQAVRELKQSLSF